MSRRVRKETGNTFRIATDYLGIPGFLTRTLIDGVAEQPGIDPARAGQIADPHASSP
jgi:hypothetical protein